MAFDITPITTSPAQNTTPVATKTPEKKETNQSIAGKAIGFGKEAFKFFVEPTVELNKDIQYGLSKLSEKGGVYNIARTGIELTNPLLLGQKIARQTERLGAQTPDFFKPQEEAPSAKKVVGDVVGTGVTVASFLAPELQLVKNGKVASMLSKPALKLLNSVVSNGLYGGGFGAASALSQDKSFKEAAIDAGYGFALGSIATAGMAGISKISEKALVPLAKNGMSRTAGLINKLMKTPTGKLAERFPKPIGKVFEDDFAEFGAGGFMSKLNRMSAQTKIVQQRFRNLITKAEDFTGINLSKVKTFVEPDKTEWSGKDAKKLAEYYYYKFGVKPDNVTELTPGLQDDLIGQVLGRIEQEAGEVKQAGFGIKDLGIDIPENVSPREIINTMLEEGKLEAINRNLKTKTAEGEKLFADVIRQDYKPHYVINSVEKLEPFLKEGSADRKIMAINIMSDSPYYKANPELAYKYIDDWGKLLEGAGNIKDIAKDNEVINQIMRDQNIPFNKAVDALDNQVNTFIKSVKKKASSLDFDNTLNILTYDPNPKSAALKYADDLVHKMTELEVFGEEGMDTMFNSIKDKINRTTSSNKSLKLNKDLDNVSKIISERVPKDKQLSMALSWGRSFATLKLSLSQVLQVAQGINNTAIVTDLPSTARAVIKLMDKASRDKAGRAAVEGLDLILESALPHTNSAGSWFGNYLNYTGFSKIDGLARTLAAIASEDYLTKKLPQLLDDPTNIVLRNEFEKFGLNPENLIKNKKINTNELLEGMFTGAGKSQFLSRPADLPAWMTSSEYGKAVAQFQSFGFQQTNLIKEAIVDTWRAGNKKKAINNILALSLLFPMTTEVTDGIRDAITGSKEPNDLLTRYGERIMDNTGIPGDIYNNIKYGNNVIESISSPVGLQPIADVFELMGVAATDLEKLPEATFNKLLATLGIPKTTPEQLSRIFKKITTGKAPKAKRSSKTESNVLEKLGILP